MHGRGPVRVSGGFLLWFTLQALWLSGVSIPCIITFALIYFSIRNKGERFCSQFAYVGSYFVRGSQLYGVTVSTSVLTYHTLIALVSHRSLGNSHCTRLLISVLFSIIVALM